MNGAGVLVKWKLESNRLEVGGDLGELLYAACVYDEEKSNRNHSKPGL